MGHRIKWSAKIHPGILKKFYAMSASGIIDEVLIDDVGIRLYLRCESMVMISQKSLYCPDCKSKIVIADEQGELTCNNCDFTFTIEEYRESFTHRELLLGNAAPYFEKYYNEYLKCTTANEKIIMIDTLIHSFHIDIKTGAVNRIAANNLIEGNHDQVVILLNELSGIQPDNDVIFAETADSMMSRRKGKRIN